VTKLPSILAHPWVVSLLLAMPALSLLQLIGAWRSRRSLLRLGQPVALAGLLPAPRRWRWLSSLLVSTGVTALLVGAAGPQWGRDPSPAVVAGRDVVILLDMSNSMRATDAPPDRFHRAVAAIMDLVDHVRSRGGHRLGLVVFAADARILCPLTHDYDLFQSKLESLDMDNPPPGLRPGAGAKSGTRFGAGLKAAISAFDASTRGYQDVIFLSDGDDPVNDGEWEAGLKEIAPADIAIYTVGLGDQVKDSVVTIPGFDGKVETHLHEGPLTIIARQTGGTYLPARLELPRLAEFFERRIEPKGETTPQSDPPPLLRTRQVWFYAGAMGLFATGWLVQLRRSDISGLGLWRRVRRNRGGSSEGSRDGKLNWHGKPRQRRGWLRRRFSVDQLRGRAAAIAVVMLVPLSAAAPTTPEDWEAVAGEAFDAGRFDDAARCYRIAGLRSSEPGRIAYNAAIAYFNQGRYREAERLFRCNLESSDQQRRGRALYNLGACLLQASEGRDAVRLGEAINCFGQCLKMSDVNEGVREDARYNMELAKQLWRRIRDDAPPPEREPPGREDSQRPDQPDSTTGNEADERNGRSLRTSQRRPGQVPVGSEGSDPVPADKQQVPAAGSMTPLTDKEQLKPLSPQEARDLLRIAGERITRERRAMQRLNVGEMKSYPDW